MLCERVVTWSAVTGLCITLRGGFGPKSSQIILNFQKMLRLIQTISIAGLLWLTWLVFSAGPGGGSGEIPENPPFSERKLSDVDDLTSKNRGGFVGLNVRKPRSLDELLEALAKIRKELHSDDEFGETLPAGIQDFINGLGAMESERLVRHFHEISAKFPNQGLGLYFQLIQYWGKLAPDDGLAFARELSASDNEDWTNVFGYTFLGWASVAPLEAWEGFQEMIKPGNGFSDAGFFMDRVRRNLLGELAKKHSALALGLISRSGKIDDGEWISWESRDSVFRSLPGGQDWGKIARDFEACKFGPGEPAALVVLSGPGPELFARWADEEPAEAIQWFTKERAASDESLFQNDWERLMDVWHERSPDKSSLWIEEQIVSGKEAKYLETLRYLFDSPTVEEPTVRAARLLPDRDERFKILKLAAHSADYEGHVSRDPFASQQNPMSQNPKLVTDLIPQFQLSESQVSEIKSIIAARQGEGD